MKKKIKPTGSAEKNDFKEERKILQRCVNAQKREIIQGDKRWTECEGVHQKEGSNKGLRRIKEAK